jgi:hypothetical protein
VLVTRRSFARLIASIFACLGLVAAPSNSPAEMVYVTSFSEGSLTRFDSSNPNGTATTILGNGTFSSPAGLAFGPDGNLYIAESAISGGTPSISRYITSNQTFQPNIVAFTGNFSTFRPTSLAFKGNDLLVGSNPLGSYTGAILQLSNIVGGSPVPSDYTSGGNLNSSPGLALSGNNTLYVSNQTYLGALSSGPVASFDASGVYAGEIIADGGAGFPPPALPTLAGPTGLAIQGNTLFTASIMNSGSLSTDLTSNSTSTFYDFGGAVFPGSLASLAGGGLLVGDASGAAPSEIYRLNSNGTLHSSFSLGLGAVGGIAVAPVPEPGTMALVGAGLVGGVALLRRRRRATMTA